MYNKIVNYLKARGWRDWFCNPCENEKSPIGDFLELIAPTHCWCCSLIRGFVYGVIATLICEIAYIWFLR